MEEEKFRNGLNTKIYYKTTGQKWWPEWKRMIMGLGAARKKIQRPGDSYLKENPLAHDGALEEEGRNVENNIGPRENPSVHGNISED